MKAHIIFVSIFATSIYSLARYDCPCCSDFHRQFDFWIGEWIVYDTLGEKIGESTIKKLQDNCLVSEHWRGEKGGTGRSYNYFNALDSTWNQVWIDNRGGNLVLKGKAMDNKMILESELTRGSRIDTYYNRITWTANNNGTVTQLWEILDSDRKLLSVAFKGIYKKVGLQEGKAE